MSIETDFTFMPPPRHVTSERDVCPNMFQGKLILDCFCWFRLSVCVWARETICLLSVVFLRLRRACLSFFHYHYSRPDGKLWEWGWRGIRFKGVRQPWQWYLLSSFLFIWSKMFPIILARVLWREGKIRVIARRPSNLKDLELIQKTVNRNSSQNKQKACHKVDFSLIIEKCIIFNMGHVFFI